MAGPNATFTRADLDFLKVNIVTALLDKADIVIRPKVPSRTLRDAMFKRVEAKQGKFTYGYLEIPHFWAVMVHDGHRSFGPRQARFLVYYRDINDDPRKPNPERAKDVRKLTRDEFNAGIAENRRLAELNPAGGPMQFLIIVVRPDGRPGRVGPSAPQPFFERGGEEFERQSDDIVFKEFDKFVRDHTPSENVRTIVIL